MAKISQVFENFVDGTEQVYLRSLEQILLFMAVHHARI